VKGLIQNLDGTAAAGSRECCPDSVNPGGLLRRADPLVAPCGFRQQASGLPDVTEPRVAVALGDAGTWGDPDAVNTQFSHHQLTGNSIISAYTVAAHRP
jgi:hypothetical protein